MDEKLCRVLVAALRAAASFCTFEVEEFIVYSYGTVEVNIFMFC